MGLRWTDVHAIGEMIYDRFPEMDPLSVRFTDLMGWVMELPEFEAKDCTVPASGVLTMTGCEDPARKSALLSGPDIAQPVAGVASELPQPAH